MTHIPDIPSFSDIEAAADRIQGQAVETPLISVPLLDEQTGAKVFLKPECLQRTGSFKFRGAYNRLSCIPEDRREAGVVACSSGNHAQGIAEAARLLGMNATIVMPSDAPAIKRMRTERSGARIVAYDRVTEDREAIALEIQTRTGATFVHPYNDPAVIAGQGTCGLEISLGLEAMGLAPDVVLVCCGGGGLTAGVALAVKTRHPDCQVFAVEPEGFDDYGRSLKSGQRETNARLSGSICDAILTDRPGEVGFAINRERLEAGLVVSDDEALSAVAFAFHEAKLVVEPGGAVALATLLAGRLDVRGKNVAAVLSGGNIDPDMMVRALQAYQN